MSPQVLRNLIDEIYGYTCKKKTTASSGPPLLPMGFYALLDGSPLPGNSERISLLELLFTYSINL